MYISPLMLLVLEPELLVVEIVPVFVGLRAYLSVSLRMEREMHFKSQVSVHYG